MVYEQETVRRYSVILSVLLATAGLIVQVGLLLLMGFGSRATEFTDQVITAVVALYVAAWVLGDLVSRIVKRTKPKRLYLLGPLLAVSCLFVESLAGSSVEFMRNTHVAGAFVDYIVKPMFWLMIIGIPLACIAGVVFSTLLHDRLTSELQ